MNDKAVAVQPILAPESLTMERFQSVDEMIVAQSTSQCCRQGICQTSINWVLSEAGNFRPDQNPFDMPTGGWVHEESSFCGRCCFPLCRAQKYTQHSGEIPKAIMQENVQWCIPQFGEFTMGMTDEDRNRNIVAYHEKDFTCPMNCCCLHPYLETKNAQGEVIGKTVFSCDACIFIPKFDVLDRNNQIVYHLRPDTCIAGCCVMPRVGGSGGKCCRVPFLIRNPQTKEPLTQPNVQEGKAQVTMLWSGFKNECCSQKNAYHLVFPQGATDEIKAVLIGSTILIDVQLNEQKNDDNN